LTRNDIAFAGATREELWLFGRLAERRLSHGEAVEEAGRIVATDARNDALVAACDAEMERLRPCVVEDARVRLVAEATLEGVTGTITVTMQGHSIVTTPEHVVDDVLLLRTAGVPPAGETASRRFPAVWKNGTAAILLHEAIGHPREHEHAELEWPAWLHVDIPLRPRRATFRDVPLLRMTHVLATQTNAPFELPRERIEILLIDGGAYEPLTQTVTIRIAVADLIDANGTHRLAPFELTQSRAEIAASLIGATGDPIRYPGVICSREGQELVVGSFAPVMVTR
jgi:hypothetical protein